MKKRVEGIVNDRYLTVPWNKFVKRILIMENEIFFPAVKISEDNIWTHGLLFYAKNFLRVPDLVYIQRMSANSVMRLGRTPQQEINFWLNPVLLGLKSLDELMNRHEFFRTNPSCRFSLLKKFVNTRFNWTFESSKQLSENLIYSAIKNEFGGKLGEYDVLIPALCTALYNEKKECSEILHKFTARIDVKLVPKTGKADFKILSISDNKTLAGRSRWLPKSERGYFIQSYSGELEIVIKVVTDGRFELNLKGLDIRNPENKLKRIPYWIDYTNLTVNDKVIFDTPTPTWHDKTYCYTLDVKAGEEITIQTSWIPHRSE